MLLKENNLKRMFYELILWKYILIYGNMEQRKKISFAVKIINGHGVGQVCNAYSWEILPPNASAS
jgi:hypothetical protein